MLNQPMSPSDESRDEKINGDTATLEYLNDKGKWSQMDFVKEGTDWKMTFPKAAPDVQKTRKRNRETLNAVTFELDVRSI